MKHTSKQLGKALHKVAIWISNRGTGCDDRCPVKDCFDITGPKRCHQAIKAHFLKLAGAKTSRLPDKGKGE